MSLECELISEPYINHIIKPYINHEKTSVSNRESLKPHREPSGFLARPSSLSRKPWEVLHPGELRRNDGGDPGSGLLRAGRAFFGWKKLCFLGCFLVFFWVFFFFCVFFFFLGGFLSLNLFFSPIIRKAALDFLIVSFCSYLPIM